jgi:hypothetical protein
MEEATQYWTGGFIVNSKSHKLALRGRVLPVEWTIIATGAALKP